MSPENTTNTSNGGGKSLRLLRPSLVVLCGPAACGKSTFAKQHFRPTQIISSDWARALICDDERDQRYNVQAFALVHFLIEQRLMVNRLCVVDSTALTPQSRKDLLDLAKKQHVPTALILFNVPLATCIERDEKRERSVGSAVVERHYQAFEAAKQAISQEGFDQITELQDHELEGVQVEVLFRPIVRPAQEHRRAGNVAQRSHDIPTQPSRRPAGGTGGNGQAATVSGVRPSTPPAVPRPAVAASPATPAMAPRPAAAASPAVPTPRPVVNPATSSAPPAQAVHPPSPPAVTTPPGVASQATASPAPVSPTVPRTAPRAVDPKDSS